MRLLFFTERFPPDLGGVARSASRIVGALSEMGHEIHVLAWTKLLDAGRLESTPLAGGSQSHRMGMFGGLDLTLQHTLNVLEWLHQQHGFDAVWGHYLYRSHAQAIAQTNSCLATNATAIKFGKHYCNQHLQTTLKA